MYIECSRMCTNRSKQYFQGHNKVTIKYLCGNNVNLDDIYDIVMYPRHSDQLVHRKQTYFFYYLFLSIVADLDIL